jgi:uncharacterized protein (DUF1697 family)
VPPCYPRAVAKSSDVHVALMRGINLAGKNSLPMKELVAIFEGAGCEDIRTYIQSGNVIYRLPASKAAKLPAVVAKAILAQHGLKVPVVTRTAAELAAAARANPFLKKGADETALHVVFLADDPGKTQLSALDAQRSTPDSFTCVGREIYLSCPNGLGRSKLTTSYFDAKLKTTSTIRNWRTVLKLVELASA